MGLAQACNRSGHVDLVHLARQTMGDRALEREVLGLFETNARIQYQRLRACTGADERNMVLHTLAGSASGIGAFGVAQAVQACQATGAGEREVDGLGRELDETRRYIRELLA